MPEDRQEMTTNIIIEMTEIFTEALRMKRSLAQKFNECYDEFEKAELRKRRAELVKKWEEEMQNVISAFAVAVFLKDEIHSVDEKLGNEFSRPEEILGNSNQKSA